MTRKEMEILKEKERKAWYEYAVARNTYVKNHFNVGDGYTTVEMTSYVTNDVELYSLLSAWSALFDLIELLKIDTSDCDDYGASEINSDTYRYLEGKGEYAPIEIIETIDSEKEYTCCEMGLTAKKSFFEYLYSDTNMIDKHEYETFEYWWFDMLRSGVLCEV